MKKKLLFSLILLVASLSFSVQAQQTEKTEGYYHAQIMQSDVFMGGKSSLKFDFGDTPESELPSLIDEDGKEAKFKNIVTALNRFSQSGWEIVSTYVLNKRNGQQVEVYYILRKKR